MTPGIETARDAGLRYVSDLDPGIRRRRDGDRFAYVDPEGREVDDSQTLARIRKLAIPPAWTDVWICPDTDGHIQATGRDARGRKQYRYHERWRAVRDENKYERMLDFARALPRIRRRVERDMRRRGLPREKVLATVVRLLEETMIRVGNEEYAQKNRSFGLTTLRDDHVKVRPARVRFYFRGKSGKEHQVAITNRAIARVVKQCQDLPGQELFQYVDGKGERHRVTSEDVNEYLRETAGADFTAKDFRTWAGTVLAARALEEVERFDSAAQARRNVVAAIDKVARVLGNTRDISRKCYVHPAVIEAYMDGTMAQVIQERARSAMRRGAASLNPEEAGVLALLEKRLEHDRTRAA